MKLDSAIKVIISGLDFAGKTSILTALNKKYNFHQEIIELKPTIKVEYHQTEFLGNLVFFWDMGGQEKYRQLYQKQQDIYFAGTDLLVYVIDIQDEERFDESLNYLRFIIKYFQTYDMNVPVIISFHKYDPELRSDDKINQNIEILKQKIIDLYPDMDVLFQTSSIYDIISIVQLISYGLSVFDKVFFELSELLEKYLIKLSCSSLILFDKDGIVISEYYNSIKPEEYVKLIESIKEHLFLLKRMQEEDYSEDLNFLTIEEGLISYLHKIKIRNESFYLSVVIKEDLKESLMNNFSDLAQDVERIFVQVIA
ncbi:MAG: hypothetical protein GF353_25150 [Candidatus Lokiarchaeota archaeon]|nr:hypothetical protein [Candidatus Lokiarchaeota archaeon]